MDALAQRFERDRPRLRAVAHRMLGSADQADDAVQETWLRLSRADAGGVDNLSAWLTTVVSRVCLDMLRTRRSRREEPWDPATEPAGGVDPEQEAVLADSVTIALLVILETLSPTERLAYVLHDMFAVSFDEIAVIVGRSPGAARQLASRARRRIREGTRTPDTSLSEGRAIVSAFLTAARGGDMRTLLSLLDPDVVARADAVAARRGGATEMRGAAAVAGFFSGKAQRAVPALIDGGVGAVVYLGSRIGIAIGFTVLGGRIVAIEAVADPSVLADLELVPDR
jgi:RNA polymerase sigma factor (sigma-70 family)